MYLDIIADCIRSHIPNDRLPRGDSKELFRIYAVLLRCKGAGVTQSDVHDAWSAWMCERNSDHESLVEYDELSDEVQAQDQLYTAAIHSAARDLDLASGSIPTFTEILFPQGEPTNKSGLDETLDLYKVMVDSSERLVGRRQAVNTFFLTINGALLTASGLIVQGSGEATLEALGIFVLSLAGIILSFAWRSLITSFGQLNTGKFKVINRIEQYLSVALYAAEWEALGRGEDPKIYRSFTSREIWVPNALLVLHSLTAVTAILVFLGCLSIGGGIAAP